jgi:HNH endonuclease
MDRSRWDLPAASSPGARWGARFSSALKAHTDREIDHIVPLAEGGRTELSNLWRPCQHHHHLQTYFGWKVVRSDGELDLVPPDDPDPP